MAVWRDLLSRLKRPAPDEGSDWLGMPNPVRRLPGLDQIGEGCRIAPSVSVFRHRSTDPKRGIRLGHQVLLHEGVRLVLGDLRYFPDADLRLGDQVIVNVGAYLSGEGGLVLETGVIVGPGALILSAGHDLHGPDPVVNRNPLTFAPVRIGRGAWIGGGAVVLQGRRIGQGAVVGAGAIVTRDVPDFAIAVGNPARIIGHRRAFQPA